MANNEIESYYEELKNITPDNANNSVDLVNYLLDRVNLELPEYTPSDEAIEFFTFLKLLFGELENENSKPQYFVVDCIFQSKEVLPVFENYGLKVEAEDLMSIGILCTREFSKSTIVSIGIMLYIASKGGLNNFPNIDMAIYVADSMDNNVKTTFKNIQALYNNNLILQTLFETVNITNSDALFIRADNPNNPLPESKRSFYIKGAGADTGVRGSKSVHNNTRPKIIIVDDVVKNETDASSDTIMHKICETLEGSVKGSGHSNGYIYCHLGTPFNDKDPLVNAINSRVLTPVVFPIINNTKYLYEETHKFRSSWSDRNNINIVRKMFAKSQKSRQGLNSFYREKMLRTSHKENCLVDVSKIPYVNPDSLGDLSQYNWYISTDLTSTANKNSNDAVIMLWAIASDGSYILYDMHCGITPVEEQYDIIFNFISKVPKDSVVNVGVEKEGNQSVHITAIRLSSQLKGCYNFAFARQYVSGKQSAYVSDIGIKSSLVADKKFDRFKNIVPKFDAHKIHINNALIGTKALDELLFQLNKVTDSGFTSKKDDSLDALTQISMIDVRIPYHTTYSDPLDNDSSNTVSKNDIYSEDKRFLDIMSKENNYNKYIP